MSSIAKVNLITELSLLPLKRYIQRKPDNYQRATHEYSLQLLQLYKLKLRDLKQTARAQKEAIESETFRLDCVPSERGLNGITIDRNNLPGAKLNDRVVLIRTTDTTSGAHTAEPLARGLVVKISDEQIKIKFQEPIFKQPKTEQPVKKESGPAPATAVESEAPEAGPSETELENRENKENTGAGEVTNPPATTSQDQDHGQVKEEDDINKKTTIDFRIKFDLSQEDQIDIEDDHSKLIESTLMNFERLKCNQTIQRCLLGVYDERSDTLNDKARVMAFTELVLKLNGQQRRAIEHALKRRLTLIEGPAGTGKTIVGAHIAANVSRQRRARVLVCSPIQETVDKLTELIDRVGGIQVVKLPSRATTQTTNLKQSQTVPTAAQLLAAKLLSNGGTSSTSASMELRRDSLGITSKTDHCHLDRLVDDEIYLQAYARCKHTLGNNHDKLHAQAYRMKTNCLEVRRRELETKVISKANVVCGKLDESTFALIKDIEFDVLILDDVQVTSELDCLIAIMTKGIKQVTLLSDTRRDVRLGRSLKRSLSSVGHSNSGTLRANHHSATTTRTNSLRKKRDDYPTTLRRSQRLQRQVSTVSENISASQSQRAAEYGGSRTSSPPPSPTLEAGNLFERLLTMGLPSVDLRIQYRCHATLSNFPIYHFYAGRLKDDTETNDKMSTEIVTRLVTDDDSFSWLPDKKYLTAIYRVPNANAYTNITNQNELMGEQTVLIEDKVGEIVDRLFLNEHVQRGEYSIGIIHNNQARPPGYFSKGHLAGIKMGTIERFIGQENDFIVLVASKNPTNAKSDTTSVGMCSTIPCDFRRSDTALNWALTRARLGLFIVLEDNKCANSNNNSNASETTHDGGDDCNGRVQMPSQDKDESRSWQELVKYYAASNLIV